jgi:hypothetical protein
MPGYGVLSAKFKLTFTWLSKEHAVNEATLCGYLDRRGLWPKKGG